MEKNTSKLLKFPHKDPSSIKAMAEQLRGFADRCEQGEFLGYAIVAIHPEDEFTVAWSGRNNATPERVYYAVSILKRSLLDEVQNDG